MASAAPAPDVLSAVERKLVFDALQLSISSSMRAAKAAKSQAIEDAHNKLTDELLALQIKFR